MNQAMAIKAMGPPQAQLQRLEAEFPARDIPLDPSTHGTGTPIVCLHGIGSGAASWFDVASRVAGKARLIAWDAPGYGHSTPLQPIAPTAQDYVAQLEALLDSLLIDHCVLVGHSLGAITAAAAASAGSRVARRIARLVLLSPARGYGALAQLDQANAVRAERFAALDTMGIAGMAAQRASRLLSDGASELARQWVRWNMARLNDRGYRQAVELLCGSDLLASVPHLMPVRVVCGTLDVVTTPEACAQVARACGVPLETIPHAGHACYVEQPGAVAGILLTAVAKIGQRKGNEA
jgi:pimeloyl-ACP methyl ester carboxylesterase